MGGQHRSVIPQPTQRSQSSRDRRYLRRLSSRGRGGNDGERYCDAGPEPPAACHLASYLRGDRKLLDCDEFPGSKRSIDEDTRTHLHS